MKRNVLLAAIAAAALVAGGLALKNRRYVPADAELAARRFVDASLAGDFAGAYALTDAGALVGRTPAAFEAKIRHELGIGAVPDRRAVGSSVLRGGFQSYGNRLRRWARGRRPDPDSVMFDFDFAAPFAVKLAPGPDGRWRVVFFEAHAA
jgi:hypothetical protein